MGGKEKVISCLSRNEPIIIFPAGEISTRHDGLHKPTRDKEWGSAIKNLLKCVEALDSNLLFSFILWVK